MPTDDPKHLLQQEFERKRGLERDLLTELISSRRNAWRVVAGGGLIMLMVVAGAAKALFMYEPPPPLVVRVNSATGEVEHVTQIQGEETSYGEVTDKSFIHEYILACESYDWNTIQNTYNRCGLLSSEPIQRAYHAKFEKNPTTGEEPLDARYGQHTRLVVNVRSITLGPNQTATVRFTRRIAGPDQATAPENLLATMAFRYVSSRMNEKDRWINPLGFQVISYQTDIEVTG